LVGCSLNDNIEPWHRAQTLPNLASRIDIEYFKVLVKHGVQTPSEYCTYIGHAAERKEKCGEFMLNVSLAYAKYIYRI
jgi:hypothetical protein